MAVFFKTAPVAQVARGHLETALTTNPDAVADVSSAAAEKAQAIQREAAGKFSWGRLTVAIVLLLALLFAAIYAAQNDKLVDLYKLLLHSFELILGAVIGLLTGEAINR